MYVFMYVYTCMYVCVYIYTYKLNIHIHGTYIYIYRERERRSFWQVPGIRDALSVGLSNTRFNNPRFIVSLATNITTTCLK